MRREAIVSKTERKSPAGFTRLIAALEIVGLLIAAQPRATRAGELGDRAAAASRKIMLTVAALGFAASCMTACGTTPAPPPAPTPVVTVQASPSPSQCPTPAATIVVNPIPEAQSVQWGVNIDARDPQKVPDMCQGQYLHPTWVRYEYTGGSAAGPAAAGASQLAIFDYQSVDGAFPARGSARQWADFINGPFAASLGKYLDGGAAPNAVEIWNEEDDACSNGPSGYCPTVPPAAYAAMLSKAAQMIKAKNPGIQVVMGGLDSGDPAYVQAVRDAGGLAQVDAIGIHPYGKSLEGWTAGGALPFGDLGQSVAAYRSASGGKPVWITETSLPTSNQSLQQEYLQRLAPAAAHAGVPVVLWFSFTDKMNPNYGLVDPQGNFKRSGQVFHAL